MRETLKMPTGRVGNVWRCEPRGVLHFWHHHEEPEFNLVTRGTARYLLSDRRYDLGPGCLVWLFPEQEHLLVGLSPDFACWIGIHRPRPLDRAIGAGVNRGLRARDPAGNFCRQLAPADHAFLDRLCADLAINPKDNLPTGTGDPGKTDHGLTYLFLVAWERFQRANDLPAGPRLHPAVERAAAALDQDPTADLEAVARAAGLSMSRLSRLFHGQIGQTLVAFRGRRRIGRFLALRRQQPGRTLLALALEAGFGSYAQFHRAFHAAMGVGPGKWEDDEA